MPKERVYALALVLARLLAGARLSNFGVSRHRLTVCGVPSVRAAVAINIVAAITVPVLAIPISSIPV
jgi:hypothetical protein